MVENNEYDCGICVIMRFAPEVGVHGVVDLSGHRPCKGCILPKLLDALERMIKG